jgi:hypothetical protein
MRRIFLVMAAAALAAGLVWAQREYYVQASARFEVHSVFPRETAPGKYEQVDQRTLQQLAEQGWELVSVMPFIYRNEERGPELPGPKAVVTQTYPAYFFKRTRVPVSQ